MTPREAVDFFRTAKEADIDTVLNASFAHYYTTWLVRGFLWGGVIGTLFWLVVLAVRYLLSK